jgi:hypothetical protein
MILTDREVAAKRREAVARAQAKQIADGWQRLHLRLPPAAARKLTRLCENTGRSPVAVIARLLLNARQ